MAQASSSWQQLINQIHNWNWSHPLFKTKGATKQQTFQRFSGPGGFLGFLTIVVAMLLWNWMLLLALLMGIGVMVLVYSMQKWDWQLHWSKIHKFLNSSNRRLVLAVISGGLATVSTYMAAAIWVDSHSSWIAAGAIIQGVGTLSTLILLVWQIVNFYENREEDYLDRLLVNLTDKDPLKRLIALRQLTKFISRQRVDSSVQQEIAECLQLLLSREEEVAIREAAFKSLQACDGLRSVGGDRLQVLPPKTAAPFVPVSAKVKHHVY
ncbi:armadillo-type fold-containing protein [Nostoc sp. FACHB-133]|uniref:armadillo-type fold-containing protein n=1 Tax=Nostoc sp. FACHB-133 TaxID=2692835 RepID=UPI001686E59A|nr:armadillo-type fold-containing protein [Nostoc sp. FACHB-133]MBD2523134.1 armadillo-type fold-containing protein [Nostoc sp. FACHB-133]